MLSITQSGRTPGDYLHYFNCLRPASRAEKPKAQLKPIVASLTTTPMRIQRIWPVLRSLTLQSCPPEKILLWLPRTYPRFPEKEIKQLPSFIERHPLIEVKWIEKDWGPGSKLLPCLQAGLPPDTNILLVDDDRIYPKHLIKTLLQYEQKDKDVALGVAGTVVHGDRRLEYHTIPKLTLVDVLLGYNGVLVKPRFFSKDIFNYPPHLPEAFFEDDVWMSGHLKKNNIRRLLVPSTPGWQSPILGNKRTQGLCMHEHKEKSNFMRVFNHFHSMEAYEK